MMVVLVTTYTLMVCISSLALELLLHRVTDKSEQYKSEENETGKKSNIIDATELVKA